MATFDDVDRITATLPDVTRGKTYGNDNWKVGAQGFAWVRPLSKADIKRLAGAPLPSGQILALSVADLGDKQAILSEGHPGVFTIAHFDSYPAILVQLEIVTMKVLGDLLIDAWMTAASPTVVEDYLTRNPLSDDS